MWEIRHPEIRQVRLDFGRSGGAAVRASQLLSDATLLINAVELVDWESAATQFLICEACGMVGCQSGGWVSLRSAGALIIVLPAFDLFMDDHKKYGEYAPPYYIKQKGVPYIDVAKYESLRAKHSGFPPVSRLRALSMREAVLALQLDVPAHAFGTPPEAFGYRGEWVIGTAEGAIDEQVERLSALARAHFDDKTAVCVRPVSENENPISFFFDFAEFTEWKPLARSGQEYHLMLNSKFVVVPLIA
jgi:hypothetical protein